MKPSEFLTKYWKVKQADGSLISPEWDKEELRFLDKAAEQNKAPYLRIKGRRGDRYIRNPEVI